MNNESGIFIFTRDRPKTLLSALGCTKNIYQNVFIVDDSLFQINRLENQRHLDSSKHNYLGQNEFTSFLNQHTNGHTDFSFLLRQLGNREWNLGFARNFALLKAKSLKFNRVLFMDDDINIPSIDLINDLLNLTEEYSFTGAHILGLVDDSILGHIATDLKVFNERMLSGGFMAFNPNTIDHYFMNIYNEDWIWLFLQLKDKRFLQTGEVFQTLTNPMENYKDKIMFQEYGEIALDGILNLYPDKDYQNLLSGSFWEKMFTERNEYLLDLKEKATKNKKEDYLKIIQHVRLNSNFKADMFKKLFEEYFSNCRLFKAFFNSLN